MDEPTNDNGRICRQSFITCIVLLLGICIPLALFPEQSTDELNSIKNSMTSNFGVVFLFAGVACFIFLLWLAMSPFGAVKFGDKNDTPEFKEFSWAGMLFCAGVGAGLLRWVLVEWGEYYTALPHGVAQGSVAAKEWATAHPPRG